jgi:phosphotransferase system IIB component
MRKIHVLRQVLKDNADVLKHAVLKNQAFIGVFYPDRGRKLTTVLGTAYVYLYSSLLLTSISA